MTKDEALRMTRIETALNYTKSIVEAVTAIEKRLANVPASDTSQERVDETEKQRHEQEPVAWYYAGSATEPQSVALDVDLDAAQKANCHPLYTAPPQRKPLSEDCIRALCDSVPDYDISTCDLIKFARAIEAAHGIKGES